MQKKLIRIIKIFKNIARKGFVYIFAEVLHTKYSTVMVEQSTSVC